MAGGDYTLDAASPCLADPACGTIGAFGEGCDVLTGVDGGDPSIPAVYSLAPCAPNPFNPATVIRFALPEPSEVTITIHDVAGRRVATVVSGPYRAGEYSAVWRGKDDGGRPVASGVYFIRMEAVDFRATRKAVLIR